MRKIRKIIIGSLVLILLCLVGVFGKGSSSPKATSTPTSAASPLPTDTPLPTATPLPPTPKPTPVWGAFSNILSGDIKAWFTDLGFVCGDLAKGKVSYSRTCKKSVGAIQLTAITYGDNITSVGYIDLEVTSPTRISPTTILPLFQTIATFPYTGLGNRDKYEQEVKAWIAANLPKVKEGHPAETKIGPVYITLLGNGTIYGLQLKAKAP